MVATVHKINSTKIATEKEELILDSKMALMAMKVVTTITYRYHCRVRRDIVLLKIPFIKIMNRQWSNSNPSTLLKNQKIR